MCNLNYYYQYERSLAYCIKVYKEITKNNKDTKTVTVISCGLIKPSTNERTSEKCRRIVLNV